MLFFGNDNGKGRYSVLRDDIYISAVKLYDLFYNGKSYAVSLRSVGFVCLIEFIEDLIQLIGGDLAARVANAYAKLISGIKHVDLYRSTSRSKLYGIVNKVYPHLLLELLVALY